MKSRTIEKLWRDYEATVIPKHLPPLGVRLCRVTFYAGAACLFDAINKALDPGTEATDADVERMEAIHQELIDFAEEFKPKP